MPKIYNVSDWYWLASDGRMFSSSQQALVQPNDAAFKAWSEDGSEPTPWPVSDGQQTEAALQWVFDNAGAPVYVTLSAYAADARYRVEISGVTAQIGGADAPVSTKREDRDGLRDTLSAIAQGWRKDGGMFKFADGIPRAATNDEMKAAIGAAFAHVQAAYDAEGAVQADLASKKPKIKTRDAVDAALAVTAA